MEGQGDTRGRGGGCSPAPQGPAGPSGVSGASPRAAQNVTNSGEGRGGGGGERRGGEHRETGHGSPGKVTAPPRPQRPKHPSIPWASGLHLGVGAGQHEVPYPKSAHLSGPLPAAEWGPGAQAPGSDQAQPRRTPGSAPPPFGPPQPKPTSLCWDSTDPATASRWETGAPWAPRSPSWGRGGRGRGRTRAARKAGLCRPLQPPPGPAGSGGPRHSAHIWDSHRGGSARSPRSGSGTGATPPGGGPSPGLHSIYNHHRFLQIPNTKK